MRHSSHLSKIHTVCTFTPSTPPHSTLDHTSWPPTTPHHSISTAPYTLAAALKEDSGNRGLIHAASASSISFRFKVNAQNRVLPTHSDKGFLRCAEKSFKHWRYATAVSGAQRTSCIRTAHLLHSYCTLTALLTYCTPITADHMSLTTCHTLLTARYGYDNSAAGGTSYARFTLDLS